MTITQTLCQEFQTAPWQIDAVIRLLDEGCTLPFIARYRKEQHGSLDDQKLREISERLTALRALEARRQEISESLQKLDVWTEKLQSDLDAAATLAQLEDIYRPYRPKRRTRASIAKEKGLEPLANALMLQQRNMMAPETIALRYVNAEKGVETAEDALQGAMDIIAEVVSDDAAVRTKLKTYYHQTAMVATVAATKPASSPSPLKSAATTPMATSAAKRAYTASSASPRSTQTPAATRPSRRWTSPPCWRTMIPTSKST